MQPIKLRYTNTAEPVMPGDRVLIEITIPKQRTDTPLGRWDAALQQVVQQSAGKIQKIDPHSHKPTGS